MSNLCLPLLCRGDCIPLRARVRVTRRAPKEENGVPDCPAGRWSPGGTLPSQPESYPHGAPQGRVPRAVLLLWDFQKLICFVFVCFCPAPFVFGFFVLTSLGTGVENRFLAFFGIPGSFEGVMCSPTCSVASCLPGTSYSREWILWCGGFFKCDLSWRSWLIRGSNSVTNSLCFLSEEERDNVV